MRNINLFDLWATLSLDTSRYEQGIANARGLATKFAGGLKSGLMTAANLSAKTLAIAGKEAFNFVKTSVSVGKAFDSSMSQVAATMGTTVDQIGELRDFAMEMGSKTAFSASQAADALNYMALAGYDSETSMSMLPNVLNLAAAGGMELARASDMITDTQSALGLTIDETSQLVDKMAKASSKTNTSVSQLGDAMLTVGGTAKNLAGGTTELAQVLGLLADNGTKGAEGGTALRNIILSLSAPTKTAKDTIEELGVEIFDDSGKMRDLQSIFSDFNSSLSEMSQGKQTQTLNKIFNKVDLKSVNALLATSTDRWNEVAAEIDAATGAAQDMADTQLDNLTGNITIFQSALEGAQIVMSDQLTPTLNKFVKFGSDGISKLTEGFKSGGLSGAMKEFKGVLSSGLTMVIDMLPDLITVRADIITALTEGLIDNIPTLVDAALTIIDERLVTELIRGIPDFIKSLAKGIDTVIKTLPDLMDTVVDVVDIIADVLIDSLPILVESVLTLTDKLIEFVLKPENLEKLVEMSAKLIISVAGALLAAAPKLLTGIGKIIKTVVDYVVNTDWAKLGRGLLDNINGALTKASSKLLKWWDGWSQEIGKYAVIAWNGVVETWSGVGQWFADRWHDIQNAYSTIGEWFSEAFTGAADNVRSAFADIGSFFTGIWEGIQGTFSNVSTWFRNTFQNAWDGIRNVFTPVGETFNGIGNSILNGLRSIVNNLISGINSVITIPFNGLNSALRGIRDIDIIGQKPFSWIGEIQVPQIPYLARGGVLKKGQMAFLEGQGDEAIIPLSQNTEWIDKVAERLSERSQNIQYSFNIHIDKMGSTSDDDIEQFAEKLMNIMTEKSVRGGYALS